VNKLKESPVAKARYSRSSDSSQAPLIEWNAAQPGLWAGRIGLDFAGLVESTGDRYLVTDWRGDSVGDYADFATAKRSLEPAERARQRELEERKAARAGLLVSGGALITILGSASVVGAWLASTI
jgi:hypothetical protein